jgi:CrcB protein
MIYVDRHSVVSQRMVLLMGSGFCGGFTTFSTFSNETVNLVRAGHARLALLYVVASVAAGLAGAALGIAVHHLAVSLGWLHK